MDRDNLIAYVFIESRDIGTAPTIRSVEEGNASKLDNFYNNSADFNSEFLMSYIEKSYFDDIEDRFGVCNKADPKDRMHRKEYILEFLNSESPSGALYLWAVIDSTNGEQFRLHLHPGNWYLMHFTINEGEGYPVVEAPDENPELSGVNIIYLDTISRVPEEKYDRLLEIFSTKHIPEIELGNDTGLTPTDGLPGAPMLREAIDLKRTEYYEDDVLDEFGKNKSEYEEPFTSSENDNEILWAYPRRMLLS